MTKSQPPGKGPNSEPQPVDLRASLQASLDPAEWSWLVKHVERDAVILVAPTLDIIDAGVQIAEDNAPAVQEWIAGGKLSKPTQTQLDAWNAHPTQKFMSLVVQPYVLIQEILH